jgi:hypothetical protein
MGEAHEIWLGKTGNVVGSRFGCLLFVILGVIAAGDR